MAELNKVVLGYWHIRGLAQPIRFLLEYTGIPYEERRYVQGDAPGYSREYWTNEKDTLGLDFPNLPFLIDGDTKLTQSNAILRHVARLATHMPGLLGNNLKEQAIVDMLLDAVMDLRNDSVNLFYTSSSDFEAQKIEYLKNLPPTLQRFEDFLGGKKFLVGDEPTVPDFHLCEVLDQIVMLARGCLQAFPHLEAYLARFQALPAIAACIQSERYRSTPVNNKTASWGAQVVR